jgi:hypothetical protein
MDSRQFDRLARSLSEAGSRRGLLGLLATMPVLGGLFALLAPEDAEAKGRRKRRKKKHKHGRPRTHGKRKKKTCKPNSLAKTCVGKCGPIKNNCKKTVECGSCACNPPCAICQTCDDRTGQCTNQANGTACGEGLQCQEGQCVCDGTSCPDGCCQDEQCHVDDDAACGAGGGSCEPCSLPDTCGGGGAAGQCGCTPNDPCTAGRCGTVPNRCGQDIECGDCGNPATPICVNNTCTACSGSNPCPDDGCCTRAGSCVADGAACDDGSDCTTGDTCRNGTCAGTPVACNTPAECQDSPGVCDATSGQCTYPNAANGTRCGNKCTQACSNGACGAGTPVTCPPPANECQVAGTCDPAMGTCSPPTNKAAGASCASTVPCGQCDGNGACVECAGAGCCGTDGQCYDNLQQCNPGGDEICCGGQCTCSSGGDCRVSPNGAVCCCTEPNQICADNGSGGTCEFCGDPDQPCCPGNTCADGGLICLGGFCELCGGFDEPCCADNVCLPNFICQGGTCAACGAVGLPCCAGDDCGGPGRICVAGACELCGVLGQPCCADGVCFVGTCFAERCIG